MIRFIIKTEGKYITAITQCGHGCTMHPDRTKAMVFKGEFGKTGSEFRITPKPPNFLPSKLQAIIV